MMNVCFRMLFAVVIGIAVHTGRTEAQRPQPSPPAVIVQTIGLSDFTISYSRPGVKGRKVWGELVTYGRVWRAGANDKTVFTFEEDVILGGQRVPKGKYSFYAIPNESEWTLIFNSDWEGHGTDHNESADVVRFSAKPEPAPHEEWLRYGFDDLSATGAKVYMHWETVKCGFDLRIAPELPDVDESAKEVLEAVDRAMIALLSQDFDGLAPLFADDFLDANGLSKTDLLSLIREMAEQGNLSDFAVDMKDAEIKVEGDRASTIGIMGTSSMGDMELDMELAKREGRWLIVK